MFRINSEEELLACFRPIDRPADGAPLGLGEGMRFPLLVRDYLAWPEPSGARMFLVFKDREQKLPLGIAFRRDAGGGPAGMCEWCHSVGGGSGVGLLTANVSAQRRVGVYLCRDLNCKQKAEGLPGVDDLPQNLSARERVWKITERMAVFARRNLF